MNRWQPVTHTETAPENDPGVVDVTPETIGDREAVALIREYLQQREQVAA